MTSPSHLSRLGEGRVESREFAWQAHAAMEGWIARADLKASILLALQGGMLFGVITSADLGGAVAAWPVVVALITTAGLLVTIGLTAWALVPVLGRVRTLRQEHSANFVYFGHLRHWVPDVLGARITDLTKQDEISMISRQLVTLGQLTWRKHRLLQVSVSLTLVVLVGYVTAAVGLLVTVNGSGT